MQLTYNELNGDQYYGALVMYRKSYHRLPLPVVVYMDKIGGFATREAANFALTHFPIIRDSVNANNFRQQLVNHEIYTDTHMVVAKVGLIPKDEYDRSGSVYENHPWNPNIFNNLEIRLQCGYITNGDSYVDPRAVNYNPSSDMSSVSCNFFRHSNSDPTIDPRLHCLDLSIRSHYSDHIYDGHAESFEHISSLEEVRFSRLYKVVRFNKADVLASIRRTLSRPLTGLGQRSQSLSAVSSGRSVGTSVFREMVGQRANIQINRGSLPQISDETLSRIRESYQMRASELFEQYVRGEWVRVGSQSS